MTTDTDTDALENLPSLPSDMDAGKAALWAATVLLQASAERRWDRSQLRRCLLVLAAVPASTSATDQQLHDELQEILDSIRSGRETTQ